MRFLVIISIITALSRIGYSQTIAVSSLVSQQETDQTAAKLAEAKRLSDEVETLYRQGKFDQAIIKAKQVLEIRENVLGANNHLIGSAVRNLAGLYIAKRRYREADPFLLRAVQISEKTLAPTNSTLIADLENYTCVLSQLQEHDKLEKFEQNRVAVLKNSIEPDRFWGLVKRITEAVTMPKPEYPSQALKDGAYGLVQIKVWLDDQGKVVKAGPMCGGHPALIQVSQEAAIKARFKPVHVGGTSFRIIGYLSYNFVRR